MYTTILVRTQHEGIHRWKDAPPEVAFLREWHRHMFHVEAEIEVTHDDRELEFILVKRRIDKMLECTELYHVEKSCEMIARELIEKLKFVYGDCTMVVTVTEDGENGGRVYYEPATV